MYDLWGWRFGERRFRVLAGLLPGLNGDVVPRDTEKLDIDLPREFMTLCAGQNLSPEHVLRKYVADVCSPARCPREDGYTSNSSDDGCMYAQMHFNRAFYCGDDV